MTDVILKAQKRDQLGSRSARKLRAQGRIPASIQGEGRPNTDVHLDLSEFLAARRHHHNLFEIDLGSESETAIVRELQWDLLGEKPVHIELRRVVRGRAIETEVDIDFRGTARSGAVQHLINRLEIRAIPSKIPDEIVVESSIFDEQGRETLTAGEIQLPEGVELVSDPKLVVAQVVSASSIEDGLTAAEPEEVGLDGAPAAGKPTAE